MRMPVGRRGMFVGKFAVFVGGCCMVFCRRVLAGRMVMLSLMVVMGCGMVMSGCLWWCSLAGCFGDCAIWTCSHKMIWQNRHS